MDKEQKEDKDTQEEVVKKKADRDDIFVIEEVKVEEMSIDGICGVY